MCVCVCVYTLDLLISGLLQPQPGWRLSLSGGQ